MADIQLFMWHTPGQSFCFVYIQVSHYYYYILISEIDSILFYLYISIFIIIKIFSLPKGVEGLLDRIAQMY